MTDLADIAERLDGSVQELVAQVAEQTVRTDALAKETAVVARQGRRNRATNVVLAVLVVAVLGLIVWVVWSYHAAQREACRNAYETRAEQEQMWADILTDADAASGGLEILHRGYARLPTPASC